MPNQVRSFGGGTTIGPSTLPGFNIGIGAMHVGESDLTRSGDVYICACGNVRNGFRMAGDCQSVEGFRSCSSSDF
jgi:hypothetical protein